MQSCGNISTECSSQKRLSTKRHRQYNFFAYCRPFLKQIIFQASILCNKKKNVYLVCFIIIIINNPILPTDCWVRPFFLRAMLQDFFLSASTSFDVLLLSLSTSFLASQRYKFLQTLKGVFFQPFTLCSRQTDVICYSFPFISNLICYHVRMCCSFFMFIRWKIRGSEKLRVK